MNVALSQCGAHVLCENTPSAAPKTSFFLNFIFELLTHGELMQRLAAFGAKTKTHHDLPLFFLFCFFFFPGTWRQAGFH